MAKRTTPHTQSADIDSERPDAVQTPQVGGAVNDIKAYPVMEGAQAGGHRAPNKNPRPGGRWYALVMDKVLDRQAVARRGRRLEYFTECACVVESIRDGTQQIAEQIAGSRLEAITHFLEPLEPSLMCVASASEFRSQPCQLPRLQIRG